MSDLKMPKAGNVRFLILTIITLVLSVSTADRATLSVAGPGITADLGMDPAAMGWLFSAFAWAYVLGMIPSGWIVDRLGAKKAAAWGLLLWSLVTFLQGWVGVIPFHFASLLVLRFLLGTFESPVGPASGRVIAAWFPSSERGIAGAVFNSAQYISLVIFTPLMGWLDHVFGWEHIFTVMGTLGLLLTVAWWKFFFMPADHPSVSKAEIDFIRSGGALVDSEKKNAVATKGNGIGVMSLLKNRMLVGIFIAQYCITAITWFFVSWFPTYLVKGLGFSILQAGFVAALPAIFGCIGGISTGFVSDWMLRKTGNLTLARKVPITIGLLMSALMIGCNYTSSEYVVIALMCSAFFGKGFGSLGWTVVADTAPKEIVGLTGGLFNAIGNIAGIITPVVIGYILALTNSFEGALLFVGLHGLVAIFSYWVIVGKIQRATLTPASGRQDALADFSIENKENLHSTKP